MDKKSNKFLFEYLNNAAPTGFESSGQKIWLDYVKPYIDDYISDTYGTMVGVINPEAEYKVVIEAHADEISWFVNYITDDGFIYLVRNGGSDHQIAPSKWVNIHTAKGIVKGVFGWPAIHTRDKGKEEPPIFTPYLVMLWTFFKCLVMSRVDPSCLFTSTFSFSFRHSLPLHPFRFGGKWKITF